MTIKRSRNVLSHSQLHQLNKWLENATDIIGLSHKKIAEKAMFDLGFNITYTNVEFSADIIGLNLSPQAPIIGINRSRVIAKSLVDLMIDLDVTPPTALIKIANEIKTDENG